MKRVQRTSGKWGHFDVLIQLPGLAGKEELVGD